jgi:D-sedoheptulose 7-phosphate isomerase
MDLEIEQFVKHEFQQSANILEATATYCSLDIVQTADMLVGCLRRGGKILVCGNGGSAADAQHLASELVGRYRRERDRAPLPAIALTTDTSLLTAISNDYGFQEVFARQVTALAVPGDVVIGISTSGRSPNVVAALVAARELGAYTVAMVGQQRGELGEVAQATIRVPSQDTPRIQEVHAVIIHVLCDLIERQLFFNPKGDE